MLGLDRKGWLRVGGYTLWGVLLYSVCIAGIPWVLWKTCFDSNLWLCGGAIAQAIPAATQETLTHHFGYALELFYLAIELSFLAIIGLLWSAISILRCGPPDGRLGVAKLSLLAFAIPSLWCQTMTVSFLNMQDLPKSCESALFLLLALTPVILPLAWCLTWAIDVVRRQRASGAA